MPSLKNLAPEEIEKLKNAKQVKRVTRKNAAKKAKRDTKRLTKDVDVQPNRSASYRANMLLEVAEQYNSERHEEVLATPDLIDPTGVSTLTMPPPLVSGQNLISALIERTPADVAGFADIESLDLNPTALHSFTLFVADGSNSQKSQGLTIDDLGGVRMGYSLSEMVTMFIQLLCDFAKQRIEKGIKGGLIFLWFHNGSKFDAIAIAKAKGISMGSEPLIDVFPYDGKDYSIQWEVMKFGECAKIVLSINCGKLGTFRMEILDSIAIIQSALGNFATSDFQKTDTPEMFTNPGEWLRSNGFDIKDSDLQAYIENAHKYELTRDGRWITHYYLNELGQEVQCTIPTITDEHPRNIKFKPNVIEALTFWKAYCGENEERYAKYDTLMLGNAVLRFHSVCRRAGVTNPDAYTTSGQIGLQAQVRGLTRAHYNFDEKGQHIFVDGKVSLKYPVPTPRVAISDGNKKIWLATPEESDEILKTGKYTPKPSAKNEGEEVKPVDIEIRYDGIFPKGVYSVQLCTWYTSRLANQIARTVQRGGRNEVFIAHNPFGTADVVLDKRSMYPSVMQDGVRYQLKDLKGQQCNALKGFVDPRVMQRGATEFMKASGCVSSARRKVTRKYFGKSVFEKISDYVPDEYVDLANRVLSEQKDRKTPDFSELGAIPGFTTYLNGEGVRIEFEKDVFFIKGRLNALKMLQARSGIFYVKLPRSACPFFREIPVIPISIAGGDVDSRLCFPDWEGGRLHCYVTGEELAYFLSEATVDDEAVEIDLERSLHGPILGIAVLMGKDKTLGAGESPFKEYIEKLAAMRREATEESESAKAKAEELKAMIERGEAVDYAELQACNDTYRAASLESLLIKNLLNAGSYGTLAQNVTPDYDESSENLPVCLDVIKKLYYQDPDWTGAERYTKEAIRMLVKRGYFQKHLKKMNGWWIDAINATGVQGMDFDFTTLAVDDHKAFEGVLTIMESVFGKDAIDAAPAGSALRMLHSRVTALSNKGSWTDLLVYLKILNGVIEPLAKVFRSCQATLMSHSPLGASDWRDVILKIGMKPEGDAIAADLLERTKPIAFKGEEFNSTGWDDTWNLVIRRLDRAGKLIADTASIYPRIMSDFAAGHMLKFSKYRERQFDGRMVERFRITLPEETASHAIRPWAVSITAKARVLLHIAMRTCDELGFKVMYCDTDSMHLAVPFKQGEDPVEVLLAALSKQKVITIGTSLEDWSIEHKYVQKEYAVGKWKAGDRIIAENTYFLGKKVIMFCDADNNILDARVSGISLKQPMHRAALYTYVMHAESLGDRTGIRREPPREMDRLAVFEYGDKSDRNVACGMYSNTTRIFNVEHDEYGELKPLTSKPVVLNFNKLLTKTRTEKSGEVRDLKMSAKDLGLRYSMMCLARNEPGGLAGCDEALKRYRLNCKIAGKSISEVRDQIHAEFKQKEADYYAGIAYYEQEDEKMAAIRDMLD